MTIIQRYLPYLAGVGVAFAWGLSFMFIRDALDHATPFHLLGLRFLTALTVMGLIRALGLIKIKVSMADYRSLLPLAFLQPILYFATETNGILLTSASYAGMMIAIIPVFTIILSVFVLKEYPTRLQVFFILASVAGVVFIIYMDNKSAFGVNPIGTLALLGAVAAAACYNITSRKASVNHPPLQITWVMMVVGAIVFNGISLTQHVVNGNLNLYLAPLATIWPAVFYLGIFASVIAFFLYNYMLSKITAAQGSVFANMVTVIAISAGVIFLGETYFWYHAAGTAAILAGVWGTNRYTPVAPLKQFEQSAAYLNGQGDIISPSLIGRQQKN